MTTFRRWLYITIKTQEEDQFFIILHRAYLLGFLLDFQKFYMKIILLFKPHAIARSACLCFKPFRNDIFKKMAMIHHEDSEMIEQINFQLWARQFLVIVMVIPSVGLSVSLSKFDFSAFREHFLHHRSCSIAHI